MGVEDGFLPLAKRPSKIFVRNKTCFSVSYKGWC